MIEILNINKALNNVYDYTLLSAFAIVSLTIFVFQRFLIKIRIN